LTFGKFLYKIPILGRIIREQTEGDPDNPLYLILAMFCLWMSAVLQWGILVLYLPAVFLAPICLIMLVLISRG
jgi:hypothetical protein